jgi:hypothetical protein
VVRRLAGENLGLEAAALGVVLVHPEEVAGPEIALLAALGALDLDDHVAALVGVAGQQQLLEPGLELRAAGVFLGDLGAEVFAHLVVGIAVEHFPRIREVMVRRIPLTPGVDDGLQLRVPATGHLRGVAISGRLDVGQAARFE